MSLLVQTRNIRECEVHPLQVADNTWKAGSTNSNDTTLGCSFSPSGACFSDRKLAAVRAYHEWMPIRQVVPDDKLRIWRNFQIGQLLDLTMLDTRKIPGPFTSPPNANRRAGQYDRDVTDVRMSSLKLSS